MLHIKNNIAVGITMAVLFMAPVACATTHPASKGQPASKEQPASKDSTPVAAPGAATVMADDSPEAIKLRSGSGNPVAGKQKSELCQGCHGEVGISIEGMAPKLAGQYAKYIEKQVHDFQSGVRIHEIMSAVAQTVSDDDLADITAYFASQTKMKGDGHDNELGKKLFLHGDMTRMMVACVNCHGVDGKGKSPDNPVFPVLGGQHKDYLRGQLINFRDGDRGNSPGGVMNIITQKLTDEELDALADYVSGR